MLKNSLESSGNKLFKYRGQIPVVLFIIAIYFIAITDYSEFTKREKWMIQVSSIIVSLLGFVVRFYAIATTPKGTSGRNTQKQVADSLNTKGIYSTVRHPLYFGNYLIWLGIVMFTMNMPFFIIFGLLYWIYYERIMFAEEMFLFRRFGTTYEKWAAKTPAFMPSFKSYIKTEVPFSTVTLLRREYSGVLATVIGFLYVDILIKFFNDNLYSFPIKHAVILGIAIVITLTLRTLKKKTNLLTEEDRS